MIRPDTIERLHLCIEKVIVEAKAQKWSINYTKHMLVNMFENNNEMFWRRVYEEKLLDKTAGFPECVIDDYRKNVIVGEGEE